MSGDPGCSYDASSNTVECDYPTIPAGGSQTKSVVVKVDADYLGGAASEHDHQLQVDKVERSVDLDPGETADETIDCGPGRMITDGSVLVKHVDQGTGDAGDVEVTKARSTDRDTYAFTLHNSASGRAQTKLYGLCIADLTTESGGHSHPLC